MVTLDAGTNLEVLVRVIWIVVVVMLWCLDRQSHLKNRAHMICNITNDFLTAIWTFLITDVLMLLKVPRGYKIFTAGSTDVKVFLLTFASILYVPC